MIRLIVTGIVLELLTGCATGTQRLYPGAALPRDQVVIVKRTSASRVHVIDGKEVNGWEWELAPGSHDLLVSVMGQASAPGIRIVSWHPCALRLVASPGATYQIEAASEASDTSQGYTVTRVDAAVRNLDTQEHEAGCRAWCLSDSGQSDDCASD